jgi:hypothetical protein
MRREETGGGGAGTVARVTEGEGRRTRGICRIGRWREVRERQCEGMREREEKGDGKDEGRA